ncbi:helix-turn-helix domain-containing protein [Leptospira kmetyi]|uniref:AraC family transcriptional regulator n=1 Tax=Leptospira kmetyi TaxID=408139 RepID=A0A2M9XTQ9_9LEPT|nr:helix-turn-helix domain-containing protein [Leptospira kmetyi]AYV54589.1 AraC family transcriptional regulator [Leptospira kmetyi]EQA52044.1 DNA-binding helix-turn-helix protein [Leptospira kmetyi serovar Malaysia str. Bejo-Iso9]PJZ28148.1 AraC family transcriptional regulator [Leptospira kmetyi]PJZ42513.1 AraC family transcriptional regulator [Leptospira kmetyi]TGK29247.1 AraC family transcriptional regulator [Leptospira kmetyi]
MRFAIEPIVHHLQLIGIYLGFSLGVLRLFRFKKNRLNVVYGINFICISFFLYLGSDADFYRAQAGSSTTYNQSLVFFGLIIYACAITRSLMRRAIGLEVKKHDLGINLLLSIAAMVVLRSVLQEEIPLNIAGNAISLLITTFTFVEITNSIQTRGLPSIYFNLSIMAAFMCLALLLDLIGIFRNDIQFRVLSNMTASVLIVYFHLLEIYFPIITDKKTITSLSVAHRLYKRKETVIQIQAKTARKRSELPENRVTLKEGELIRIEEKLALFLEEKRFLDEELRLPDLSAYLGISVHQASLYLNQYKNLSFADFINQHRIEEAKRLIVLDVNKNLIDIGLECGFNSYSPFHRACIRFTGYSPKDLKNLILKKEDPKVVHLSDIAEKRTT